jgi:RimJ/RimL family protein N-acetyltransferase
LDDFYNLYTSYPSAFDWLWLPFGDFASRSDAKFFVEDFMRKDNGRVLFGIYDLAGSNTKDEPLTGTSTDAPLQTPPPAFAGVLSYINASALNLCAEIGYVIVFPPWQRTHVAKNAAGLLMKYALDVPPTPGKANTSTTTNNPSNTQAPSTGGLGLRRVVWQANARNIPSVKLAKRMGFHLEGILRWDRALPPGKEHASNHIGEGSENANTPAPSRHGDPKPGWVGRDTAILSVCWDDWENGVRELVLGLMEN